jgi:hypothetical protein
MEVIHRDLCLHADGVIVALDIPAQLLFRSPGVELGVASTVFTSL